MVKSMTGYGRARETRNKRDITVEVRSVNNRYLDCTVKLPRAYVFAEDAIKGRVQKAVSRGKVDVFVTIDSSAADVSVVKVNEPLARKWEAIRRTRRVVTAALEIKRTDKVIGASLEAAPVVHIEDKAVLEALKSVDFADICITSGISLTADPIPDEAFRLPDVTGVGVVFEPAEGEKCQRCWKILPDVGTHAHPGTCARCNEVLSEESFDG